jgi:hypothetical protein
MERNHMGIAPQLPNTSFAKAPHPFSTTIGHALGQDLLERKYNDIDPFTLYPRATMRLIKEGKLKGTLTPLFDEETLPLTKTFWAYRIGQQGFPTLSGALVWGVPKPFRIEWWMIVLVVGIILLVLFLRLKGSK